MYNKEGKILKMLYIFLHVISYCVELHLPQYNFHYLYDILFVYMLNIIHLALILCTKEQEAQFHIH